MSKNGLNRITIFNDLFPNNYFIKNISKKTKLKYTCLKYLFLWVFVFPSRRPWPPSPNLYLAAPALNLYLPALAN